MDEKFTTSELAKLLKVQPVTIRKWAKEGIIPFVHVGKVVRFEPDKVWQALQKATVKEVRKWQNEINQTNPL